MRHLMVCLLCFLLTACGSADHGDLSAFAPAEEDRMVIYTSHPESVYGPLVKEFEERTGVWVQVETGGTTELLERIEAERTASPPGGNCLHPIRAPCWRRWTRRTAAETAAGRPSRCFRWCWYTTRCWCG